MNVCGHEASPALLNQYRRMGVYVYVDGLLMKCRLCAVVYQHWLIDDAEWCKLPAELHRECLCLNCYTTLAARLRKPRNDQEASRQQEDE